MITGVVTDVSAGDVVESLGVVAGAGADAEGPLEPELIGAEAGNNNGDGDDCDEGEETAITMPFVVVATKETGVVEGVMTTCGVVVVAASFVDTNGVVIVIGVVCIVDCAAVCPEDTRIMLGDGLCPPAVLNVFEASVGVCDVGTIATTKAVVVGGGGAMRANRGSAMQGGVEWKTKCAMKTCKSSTKGR
jgi:hypothetical protein